MTKKLIALLAIVLALVCVFAVTTFAADPVTKVYVTAGGAGTKDGLSHENAASSLGTATAKLTADGTVYIVGTYNFSGSRAAYSDSKYNVTITAYDENSVFNYAGNMFVTRNTYDKTLTFDMPITIPEGATWKMFGGFNNITFSENFDVIGGDFEFFGGWTEKANDERGVVVSPETAYTITVKNGKFAKFHGGNERTADVTTSYLGSIIAPVTINISGGTFGKEGTYDITSNNKDYDAFSISGESFLADNATLNITGGTFNTPLFVQGRIGTVAAPISEKSAALIGSDAKYYALDGDVAINITGGTFYGGLISAYYTQAAYTTLLRGDFDVSIEGGTFKEGTVIDATQVKAYEGQTKKATLTYTVENVEPKRFDVVNDEAKTYEEPIRVVFIGDSITEGYASPSAGVVRLTDSYPAKFLKEYEDNNTEREVIVGNFGVSSAGFHPKLSRFYSKMLAYPMVMNETDPTYVVLAMGTNDASSAGGTHGALLEFSKNYKDILTHFGEMASVKKVFATNAIYRRTSGIGTDLRCTSVMRPTQEKITRELMKTSDKYEFVDLYGLTLSAAIDDSLWKATNGNIYERLHPTTAGYELMGKCIYNAIFKGVYEPAVEYANLTEVYVSDKGSIHGKGTKDDPISFLPYAISLLKEGEEVTIYIDGTLTLYPTNTLIKKDDGTVIGDYITSQNVNLPSTPSKLNVVGVGNNAKIRTSAATFKIGTDTKFDNITLEGSSSAVHFVCEYNNVEITDSVKTTSVPYVLVNSDETALVEKSAGRWYFLAGYNAQAMVEPSANAAHDSVESVSSDKDVTVTVNGGTFARFMLGNNRYVATAPFGTYSGNMQAVLGGNLAVDTSGTYKNYIGIVGHNYNTGTVTVNVYNWVADHLPEYVPANTVTSPVTYDASNNTGTVTLFNANTTIYGDADGDGELVVKDVLTSLDYYFNGVPFEKQAAFEGKATLTLIDLVKLIAQLVK